MTRVLLCICLLASLVMSGQNISVMKEGGRHYTDAFIHDACELYDWHVVENAFAKKIGIPSYRCYEFFTYSFRTGLFSINDYLAKVEQKKITKENALKYWLDQVPLFEKVYKEKYIPMVTNHEAAHAKQGNGSNVQTGGANCNNLDFSTGTNSGWTGQWNNQGQAPDPTGQGLQMYGALTVSGFDYVGMNSWGHVHEICTGGIDRNVPVNCVPPGHNYAMRLGNDSAWQILSTNNNQAIGLPFNHQIISNTFLVTQQNKAVSYWYAVVLCQYNPNNHASNIQPYFQIRMYDASGAEITCAHYDVDALTAPTIGGFQTIEQQLWDPNANSQQGGFVPYDFFYKDWSQVMIPLGNYVGQNVTITFETSDCAGGGHPGYAYVAADCTPMPNIAVTPFSCGSSGSTATLVAPGGAATYSWAGPGIVGSTSSQTCAVNAGGSYTVTMTTLGNSGTICSFTADTTIAPPQPAVVASFTNTTDCVGTPIQFTDMSNTNGGTASQWQWNFGDGTSSTLQNPTHIFAPGTTSPINVSFTVTTAAGCTDTYWAPVTVLPSPTPAFTSNKVCIGNPTTFTNTSGGAVSYVWNFGDGSGTSTLTDPTHTYPNATTYFATLTATGANSCTAAISAAVIVNPQPVVSFTAPPACFGSLTQFNNTSTYAGNSGTFAWTFGDAGTSPSDTSTKKNPSFTYTSVGVHTVTLTVNAGAGCQSTGTATISILPLPSATVTSPQPFCPGATVPSPVVTSTPANGVTYTWGNNNTVIGLGASGAGVPPPFTAGQNSGSGMLTGIISIIPHLNGCAGPPTKDTIRIMTAPLVVQANVELCPNSVSNPINFITVPAGVPASFNWTNTTPGTYIGLTPASGTGSIPSFTTIDPGSTPMSNMISVAASLNGCVGPPATFFITDNPYPHAAFYHSSACEGNHTQFTNSSTISTGAVTQWNWDLDNDGNYNDSNMPNPDYVFPTAGTFNVNLEVVSDKGCKNDTTEIIVVNPSPKVNIFGDVLDGCSIHTVNFTDSVSVPLPQHVVTYNWYFGNGTSWHQPGPISSSFTNVSHNTNAYYTISLQVVSDSGCIGSVQKVNYITVYPIPKAAFTWGPTDADVFDPTIHLNDQSIGGSGPKALLWYLGDTHAASPEDNYTSVQNPVHTYSDLEPGVYTVTQWVENIYGCRDSASDNVSIHPAFTFYAPNAFTPGFDDLNNGFKGTGIGIDESTYHMWIYDRWGNLVFETHNLEEEWNGKVSDKAVQQDTYAWKAEFKDTTGKDHHYKGVVNLIR